LGGTTCCPDQQVCGDPGTEFCCPDGQACCGNQCIPILTDTNNCGGCGIVCDPGEQCIEAGCLGAGQLRIVLRWNEDPRDLDSHLWLPAATPYHIYFANEGASDVHPFAELDHDDVTSFGPETITISDLLPGTYLYAVHLFAGAGTIGTSEAEVKIYEGTNPTATHTFPVPVNPNPAWDTDGGTVVWWHVFDIVTDGTNVTINTVDESTTDPAPYADPDDSPNRLAASSADKKALKEGVREAAVEEAQGGDGAAPSRPARRGRKRQRPRGRKKQRPRNRRG
jgi:hypothetical protein